MMPYERFHAWKACDELTIAVYLATGAFPKHELYGLTSQSRRAAFSLRLASKLEYLSPEQGRSLNALRENASKLTWHLYKAISRKHPRSPASTASTAAVGS